MVVEEEIYKASEILAEVWKENKDICNQKWMIHVNSALCELDEAIKELEK